jgi:hypothetical protein
MSRKFFIISTTFVEVWNKERDANGKRVVSEEVKYQSCLFKEKKIGEKTFDWECLWTSNINNRKKSLTDVLSAHDKFIFHYKTGENLRHLCYVKREEGI